MKLQEMLDQLSAGNASADDDDAAQPTPRRRRLADVLREIDTQGTSPAAAATPAVEKDDYIPKPPDPNAAQLPPEELDLFNYEQTAAAADLFGAPIDPVLADEEFLVEYVPEYLRPFVRVVAKGVDGALVKPTIRTMRSLNVGLTAVGETTSDAMAAFTQAVQDGIVEGSTFERLTGLKGTDIIPFDPKTSGRKFTGDLIDAAMVADAPIVASAGMAKMAMQAQMKALTKRPDLIVPRSTVLGAPLKEGTLTEKAVRAVGADVKKIDTDAMTPDMIARAEKARQAREESGEMTISEIQGATAKVADEKRAAARAKAKDNDEIRQSVIENFEIENGLEKGAISKTIAGKTYIDYEKMRELGLEKIDFLDLDDDIAWDMGVGSAGYRNPVLNPDKLDAVVATVADVKALNPAAFKGSKNVMETLFRETVNGNLIASDELLTILNQYGLSLDDYILMTVGSATKYGKGLQKFSQMGEAMGRYKLGRPAGKKAQDELDQAEGLLEWLQGKGVPIPGAKKIGQNIRRTENVARGLMVSAFATAARNLESTIIRMPLEGMTNLLSEAIIRGVRAAERTKAGDIKGARDAVLDTVNTFNPMSRKNAIGDSFGYWRHLKDPLKADELTKFILEQPENVKLLTRYRDQIVEAQKATGKGEGGISDFVFNPIEDFVDTLNVFNRGQEFISRNAYFLTDLSRNLKREWGISLEDAIKQGKIRELINDSPTLRPTRGNVPPPSFAELATDAVESALNKTYASPPEFGPFKAALKFLNAIPGSTIAIPFPRFMFKAMEYIYSGLPGTAAPAALRIALGKGNTVKDAEAVSRNIVGYAALLAAYEYRTSDDAPEEYNKIANPDGTTTNIDPQFPLSPALYIAEAKKQYDKGGADYLAQWLFMNRGRNFKNGVKSLTGTNFRNNQTFGEVLDDVSNMFAEDNDALKSDEAAKAFGKAFGNTLTRMLQPYSMVLDMERALGMRDMRYKTFEGEPNLSGGGAFVRGFMLPFAARGYLSPKAEADAPVRNFPMLGEKRRIGPTWKLALGINIEQGDNEWQKYLKSIQYADYDFASKSGIDIIDNTMNALYNELLPDIAKMVMEDAPKIKEELKKEGRFSEKIFLLEQRNRIDNNKRKMFEAVKGAQFSGSKNPAYVMAVNDLRRVTRDRRILAMSRLSAIKAAKGEPPVNLGDTADVMTLVRIAKGIEKER
jgi:hypothetical protein